MLYMRGRNIAYYGLGTMHFFVMLYYVLLFVFATIGLVFHTAVLGTIHFFVLIGIAVSQLFVNGDCPLTKFQNRLATKLGKRPIKSFIANTLQTVFGWQPHHRNVRRATITATVTIIAYYAIVHFALF
jgi:hypothetical protein